MITTVLVTAGPTREHLDDVRFLSNASTGRMGYAIARAARDAGHRVVLVTGPSPLPAPDGVQLESVESALEMADAVERELEGAEVVFGVAAVADARPSERVVGKPAKSEGAQTLTLLPNPDIIAAVAARGGPRAVVGFALEAAGEGGLAGALDRARDKLVRKGLDAIAVNLSAALGAEDSEVVLLFADGREEHLPLQNKDATATRLLAAGLELWQQKVSKITE